MLSQLISHHVKAIIIRCYLAKWRKLSSTTEIPSDLEQQIIADNSKPGSV